MFWKRSEPEQTLAAERGRSPSDAASVCGGAGEATPAAAVDCAQVFAPAEITPPLTAAAVVDQASAGAPPAPQADAFAGGEPPPEEPFEEIRKRLLAGPRKSKGRRLVKPEESPQPAMTPEQRLLILDTWQRSGLPAGDFAPLVGLSKHTLYSWKKRFEESGPAGLMDQQRGGPKGSRVHELTKRTILMLKQANPEWGCQRISDMLLRGPALPASPGAVSRVLHEAGYQVEEVATHPHPDKQREFERATPNQLWQTDLFTFVLKRQNRRVYMVAFMDDHSRFISGYGIHASQSAALVLEVVRAAIVAYGTPQEILTDNGSQYVTWRGTSAFHREMDKRGIKDRRINYCRRFHGIVVVYEMWMFSETEDSFNGTEAKDGFCISAAVRTEHRGADAGVFADVVRTGSTAIRGPRSGAIGTRWNRVCRRCFGMFNTDHRARSRRTRPVADRPGCGTGTASGCWSKKKTESEPELVDNLKAILDVRIAGDPDEKDVLWTDLSPRQIADAVTDMGTPVSSPVVQDWMEEQKLGRHKIEKVLAGGQSPDRDAQFLRIAKLKAKYFAAGNPVFSLDTKAKEHLGQLFREGRVWTQQPFRAFDHDFPSWATGVIIPHGIYDLARNRGHINIGLSHDTSQFACDSFRWYWNRIGQRCYPYAKSILLLCDCGGSNSAAQYLFKQDLQHLVNDLGIEIRVAHYPSYCSKFNPIERRFFPHVGRACQGMLFDTLDTVVRLMRKASTTTGLQTTVNVIHRTYEIGRKVADSFKTTMTILFDNLLPKWNYVAKPR